MKLYCQERTLCLSGNQDLTLYEGDSNVQRATSKNCWFSHDVTKFQTSELLILLRFYFHDVLEQLKANIQTNFHSEWVLGLVIDYA